MTDEQPQLWHRTRWSEAIWSSTELRPLERLVALAYADHARSGEEAWVSYGSMIQRTGLGRTAVIKSVRRLLDAGWLVLVRPSRQQHPAVYRLVVPSRQGVVSRTSEAVDNPSSVSSRDTLGNLRVSRGDARVSRGDARVSRGEPNLSNYPRDNLSCSGEANHSANDIEQRIADAAVTVGRPIDRTRVLAELKRRGVRSPVAYLRQMPDRDIADLGGAPPPEPLPAWCGQCDEANRQFDVGGDRWAPCPRCSSAARRPA